MPPSKSSRGEERQIWPTQMRRSHSTRITRMDRQRPASKCWSASSLQRTAARRFWSTAGHRQRSYAVIHRKLFTPWPLDQEPFGSTTPRRKTDLRAREAPFQLDNYGRVVQVRYNDRSVVPPNCDDYLSHDAWTHFGSQLAQAKPLKVRLRRCDALVFDNTRILYARERFYDPRRCLEGCYIDSDEVWPRLAFFERQRRLTNADYSAYEPYAKSWHTIWGSPRAPPT